MGVPYGYHYSQLCQPRHSVDHHFPVHDAGGLDRCTLALRVATLWRVPPPRREGLEILSSPVGLTGVNRGYQGWRVGGGGLSVKGYQVLGRCWEISRLPISCFCMDLFDSLSESAQLQKVFDCFLSLWRGRFLIFIIHVFFNGGGALWRHTRTYTHKGRNRQSAFCDVVHGLTANYMIWNVS